VTRLFNEEEALNPSIVKCVFDQMGNALYFSRALIPAKQGGGFSPKSLYYRHLGLYAYRRDFLLKYAKLTPTPLQLAEDLEQLKILEHGYRIKTAIVKAHSIGVDTPNDIKIIEQIITRASAI
jgi:3-deoxy-manno-octulosonate cytidylyltransferase (CMP-KDO synthetase)